MLIHSDLLTLSRTFQTTAIPRSFYSSFQNILLQECTSRLHSIQMPISHSLGKGTLLSSHLPFDNKLHISGPIGNDSLLFKQHRTLDKQMVLDL